MSYRRTWLLVDVMNRSFAEPLVHAAKGGKHGGGTTWTPMGLQVLAHYQKMNTAVHQADQSHYRYFRGK